MAGVKVTLQRMASVNPYLPITRLFEAADGWVFGFDRNLSTLHIIKEEGQGTEEFKRTTIAEFPASGIESVEFA